jgi:hypothetical protein
MRSFHALRVDKRIKEDDNVSASSSYELSAAPSTRRAGINVRLHLIDIHSRRSHTTVDGVQLDSEKQISSTNDVQTAEQLSVFWH